MKKASLKMAILVPAISVLVAGILILVVSIGMVGSSTAEDLTGRVMDARVNEYSKAFEANTQDAYAAVRTTAPVLETLAADSASPRDRIVGTLESVQASSPNFLSVWTCWEPNAVDGKDAQFANSDYHDATGRFIPSVSSNGVEALTGYDEPGTGDYYLGARNSGKTYVSDPYTTQSNGESVNVYTVAEPIIRDGAVVGVVGINIRLDSLIQTMNAGSILEDGYLFALSPNGSIATHKDPGLIMQSYKTTWMGGYSEQVEKTLSDGASFDLTAYSDVTNTNMEFLAAGVKIGDSDKYWAICGVVPSATVNESANTLLMIVIGIGAALIVLTALTIFFLIRNSLRKLPDITAQAGRIAVGDISQVKIDKDESATKNEITLLERAFGAIAGSIQEQSAVMEKIAAGDYSMSIAARSDEDMMNKAIGDMLDKTNSTLSQIGVSSEQVSTGASQVADGAQALAAGSTEQAASVEELSGSIAEIAERTKKNAELAEQAAVLAGSIKQSAEKGSRQMDEMMTAVKDINLSSQDIGKVIKVIDDIAFQTNILALNAAVEAARAGQHGKGFAVVAEEVRNLAAKSAEAAKDTESLIANSMQKAELGVRIAGETAESLSEIVAGIGESNRLVSEIATASEAQSMGISQINTGIDQVAQVVQQNSATAEESAAASEEMSGQSTLLSQLIQQFKLRGGKNRRSEPQWDEPQRGEPSDHHDSTGFSLGGDKY